ncbi:MAG: hypothetical protein ACW98F_13875 [Candidatus Hodarchaeales archaeon]|jgi:hypothetical protein
MHDHLKGCLIIFTLLMLGPQSIVNRANQTSFGVNEGEALEFGVIEKPERPSFTLGSSFPLGINISDIRALSRFTTNNFTLQPIFDPIPPENTNFTISIIELEETTGVAKVNISHQISENVSNGRNEYQILLNNLLGEPVISTNWQKWIQVVDSLSSKISIDGKEIVKSSSTLTNQTFKTTVIIKPSIPSKLRFYLTNVKVNQTLCYFTNTGIQAYMIVITTYSILFMGDFESVTYYKYVGENSELIENISLITKPFDLLQIILPIVGGMGLILTATLVIILLKRRLR